MLYLITQELLVLPDGSEWRCVAGGGRGRRLVARDARGRVRASRHIAAAGERDWRVKAKGQVRGGPLPPGRYLVHPPIRHPRLGPACFLEPLPGNDMHGRDDFWIHGPGPRGSDGCIVPVPDGRSGRGSIRLMQRLAAIAPCALVVFD
jgi:hypothetical protein